MMTASPDVASDTHWRSVQLAIICIRRSQQAMNRAPALELESDRHAAGNSLKFLVLDRTIVGRRGQHEVHLVASVLQDLHLNAVGDCDSDVGKGIRRIGHKPVFESLIAPRLRNQLGIARP